MRIRGVVFGLAFLIAWFSVNAPISATTIPYLITNPIPSAPVTTPGQTFLETDLTVNYQSGEIVLSKDTPPLFIPEINDAIEIVVTHPDQSVENFNYLSNLDCLISPMFVETADEDGEGDGSPFDPLDLTNLFVPGTNQVHIRLYVDCSVAYSSSTVYLVNTNAPASGPAPFLRLPWDYAAAGKTFDDAALTINSYFDHTYPLASTSLVSEPAEFQNQITTFNPNFPSEFYSSHDGYDYGRLAAAFDGSHVLAAAEGCATYGYSKVSGNVIKINHHNG